MISQYDRGGKLFYSLGWVATHLFHVEQMRAGKEFS